MKNEIKSERTGVREGEWSRGSREVQGRRKRGREEGYDV